MKNTFVLIKLMLVAFCIQAQDIQYAQEIITKLTSPEMFGRGYVKGGEKLTANYIVSELKKMNLEAKLQKFNVPVNTFPGAISVAIDGVNLEATREFIVEPASPSLKGNFDVIVCSRKDINSKEKLISLVKKASGAFVYLDNSKAVDETKDESKTIEEYINFIKYSEQISVKGFIINTSSKLSWSSADFIGPRPVIQVNKLLEITKIKSITIDIKSKFYETYETQNIICNIPGTSNTDSLIVYSAHYDHLGMFGEKIAYPGANDNASGIALLLYLAKHFASHPPKHNIRLIAFSANELNIRGSRYYIEQAESELSKIKFLINFDIVGTGEEGINTVNGREFVKQFEILSLLNSEKNYLPKIDKRGKACNSDHCFFTEKGIPCFFIYTQGGIKAYHDLDDRAETLPLTEFLDLLKLMIEFETKL